MIPAGLTVLVREADLCAYGVEAAVRHAEVRGEDVELAVQLLFARVVFIVFLKEKTIIILVNQ